ncbi:UCH-domain-containing protein [Thelephora ganbajun]|uniref:UCH-domain-containing protein n=1 Tax=Thelephora ganbajun TaxID=370292 RepID=A0ACB6Z8L6_THEGA|nr:UCH-domain-containing protein [Thelephora ganbajun]
MSLPLPPTTTNDAVNDIQAGSRKRQRSLSMESDSSSPKRSASEDPTQDSQKDISDKSARPSNLPSEPTPVVEDSPMNDGPISSQDVPMSPSSLLLVDPSTIEPIITRPLQIGETWYIVHKRWIDRWRKAFSGQEDKEEGYITEATLGPPDKENHNLLDERNNLRKDVTGETVDFVPGEVWDRFVSRYGTVNQALPRKVIARGIIQQPTIEMHPLVLKVVRVADPSSPTTGPFVHRITISAAATVKELYKAIHALFNVPETPFRIWSINDVLEDAPYEVSKLKQEDPNPKLWTETDDLLEHEYVGNGDSFAVEFQKDGQWPSNTVPQNHAPAPLFGTGNDFFGKVQARSLGSKTDDAKPATATSSKISLWKSSTPTSSKRAPEPGTLGLGNMGNTCFMNSALQCLAHTKELCQYFVSGVFEGELNPDNPLGMQGAIAEAFGALLRRIWSDSSTTTSYSPREFKQALQRFAPQFIGYQQHDSQELVAFLLDGLHEDLNRILKKPYVEKPDWEGGGDEELVKLANISWEGYLKRNDSVIVDLFQGQYKSTLVCPECAKVSITFDPFMYLTLPLPVNKKWTGSIYYMPWTTNEPILKIPVELPRDASFKELRKLLGRWMEVPPDNLLTVEVFNSRFYKGLDDHILVSETAENDILVCYQLPCHAQQARSYKRDQDDPYIVPLYRTDAAPSIKLTYGRGSPSYFGYPLIAVIDQETAKSRDAIYTAVIERLERGATSPRDLYTWEGTPLADSTIEQVSITLDGTSPISSVTEIKPNGEVVMVQETPEEGDITDEKSMVVEEVQPTPEEIDVEPKKLGPKADIFVLQLQNNSNPFAPGFGPSGRYESWAKRGQDATADEEDGSLLREGDTFVCEFDEHMKGYFFSDLPHSESLLWKRSQQFTHTEYLEARKGEAEKINKGITLQDCLEEFTREEKLGEDDLWYCPRCKKHQQATKRFDLWKLPEILVVHLKRFSNSRILRDKIDTFVNFPIEGLDLETMVGEREVAMRLQGQGFDISSLGLREVDEPLVYDLYAVDEHLGGLGGGHYRAYASNHITEKWYHFDDSFVTESTAEQAVNSNAYLLFYRRRTIRPLGGKTYEKIASSAIQTNGVWAGPGPEIKSIVPKYATVHPASPEQTERQGGLFDHITSFNDLAGPQPWGADSPRSSPPPLEEQPAVELMSMGYMDFPDPNQINDDSMIYHSNPHTPPSDGGYKEGTMTQESVDRWARSLTAKFTEDSSDSVRPSPPSSSNGDDVNPFQLPEEDGLELISVEIDEVSMGSTHTTLNDIDL